MIAANFMTQSPDKFATVVDDPVRYQELVVSNQILPAVLTVSAQNSSGKFPFAVLQAHVQMVPNLFKFARPSPSHCKENSSATEFETFGAVAFAGIGFLSFLLFRQLLPTMFCLSLTQLSLVMYTRSGSNRFPANNHKKPELHFFYQLLPEFNDCLLYTSPSPRDS